MKTIKFLFLLIILGLLGLLVYQNIDYFTAAGSLSLDLKFNQWQWTTPSLPNWAFWGMCFGLGLLITGMKGMVTAYGLGREIKKREAEIAELRARNNDLQNRLDVFTHDPYIKKGLSGPGPEPSETETGKPDPLDMQTARPEDDPNTALEQKETDTPSSDRNLQKE
jgi:hypothetical protein